MLQKNEAVIIGMWESMNAYTYFMNELHDQIMDTNKQKKSYEKIEVSLWETDETIHVNDIQALERLTVLDIGTDRVEGNEVNQKNDDISH
ncbi:DUF4937 domain-containing protein [Paenibacillus thiaminolyticus]|uniref:DUF4937 domain-containing protein n=1 Tax=Paenibacillus thiaminolyticus TaxID=49283 RepID=UPI0034DDA4B2